MPRPKLSKDPHNLRRINVLSHLHDTIYYLRHCPHRLPEVVAILHDILSEVPTAITSSSIENDIEFERCAYNLLVMLPVSLRLLQKHKSNDTYKDVASDLIRCIPHGLQQSKLFDPQVDEPEDEEAFDQNSRHSYGGR
jgi:hypothetical protein